MNENDLVFVVDENNNPLVPRLRSQAIRDRLWRRTGGGFALDKRLGLLLCHKRSLRKDERPTLWVATFGGKSHPKEPALETATRELHEEFGFEMDKKKIEFIKCVKSEERRQFEYLFVAEIDSREAVINPQDNEVAEFGWFKLANAIDNLQHNSLWFSYGYEIDILNSLAR
jgi:isopentenyldiphosphate isomerase